MTINLPSIKKFLAALAGAVAVAVSLGLLPSPWDKWVPGVISVITAFLVYFIPNQPQPPGDHEAK